MNLSFLSKFFLKEKETLLLSDSPAVIKLQKIAQTNTLFFYQNIKIFHHSKSYFIPVLLLDLKRGIYIFKDSQWCFDDLKNSTIEKAENQSSTNNALAFQSTQKVIHQKFKELTHQDKLETFNFLIMENLSTQEYESLDDSFKKLLPQDKIIFSDTDEEEILTKLQTIEEVQSPLPSHNEILGTLFVQYTHLDYKNKLQFCTQEQIDFINLKITSHLNLSAQFSTGKSSSILLKAVFTKLEDSNKKILIIKPTKLSADIFKQKLLAIIEHAIVEIDFSSINILTPLELVNLHLKKLKKELLTKELFISPQLMKKKFYVADLIFCDDTDLMENDFLEYLVHIQEKKPLILVNSTKATDTFHFTKQFSKENCEVYFLQTNPYDKTLKLISTLLENTQASDILVVSDKVNQEKLNDKLESFIDEKASLLDATQNLINQELDSLLLATYKDIAELKAKHVILLDICSCNFAELEFAYKLADKSVYILYEKECSNIQTLKENYESNKNSTGMERTTHS